VGKLPDGAWGVGAAIFLNRVEPTNQGASFGRLTRGAGKEVVFYDLFGKPEADIDFQPCPEKLVRLRMKRTGSQVSYLLSKGVEGEKFEEIGTKDFGRDEIQQVTVRVLTGKKPFSVDARLIDLRIRSGGPAPALVAEAPQPGSASLPKLSLCLAAAIVGMFTACLVGAWIYWRQPGRAPGPTLSSEASTTPVSFACSGCGRRLTVATHSAGKKVKCKACGMVVAVPAH
jgi:hypothetical protein